MSSARFLVVNGSSQMHPSADGDAVPWSRQQGRIWNRDAMSELKSYLRSLERSREAATRADRPATFAMYGRDWDLLPEVFAPNYSPTTGYSMRLLGLVD